MKNPVPSLLMLSALPLLSGGTAQAHHSGSMFDMMNCHTLTGTVRALQWAYPHTWLWIDVRQAGGAIEPWGFESPSPTQLEHIDTRWQKGVMAKGDRITVEFGPLKDGRHGGALALVTLANGQKLVGSPGLCGQEPNPTAAPGRTDPQSAPRP